MRQLCLLISALLVACANLNAQTNAFELTDLGHGIYVHHGKHLDIDAGYQGDICNLSAIVGEKGIAIIDTGGSKAVGLQFRNAIKRFSDKPILYVINTHLHPDHVYGNGAFNDNQAIFIGHEKLAHGMQLRQEQYEKLNAKLLGTDGTNSPTITPTQSIKTLQILDLGGRTLTLTAHPTAHTQTDLSVVDNQTNTLFAGDLLFTQRTPVLEGDIKGVISALEQFKGEHYQMVVPGHGLETKTPEIAFNDELRYLSLLLTDIRSSIKNGINMEDTMTKAASSEKDKWLLFDVANRRNVNIIYPQLEWE